MLLNLFYFDIIIIHNKTKKELYKNDVCQSDTKSLHGRVKVTLLHSAHLVAVWIHPVSDSVLVFG